MEYYDGRTSKRRYLGVYDEYSPHMKENWHVRLRKDAKKSKY